MLSRDRILWLSKSFAIKHSLVVLPWFSFLNCVRIQEDPYLQITPSQIFFVKKKISKISKITLICVQIWANLRRMKQTHQTGRKSADYGKCPACIWPPSFKHAMHSPQQQVGKLHSPKLYSWALGWPYCWPNGGGLQKAAWEPPGWASAGHNCQGSSGPSPSLHPVTIIAPA